MKNIYIEHSNLEQVKKLSNHLTLLFIFLWTVAVCLAMNQFHHWNWHHGLYRGGLLGFLGLSSLVFFHFRTYVQAYFNSLNYPILLKIIIILCCFGMLFYSLHVGFNRYQEVKKTNYIGGDVGLQTYAAFKILERGGNPYGMNVLTNHVTYKRYIRRIFRHKQYQCLFGYESKYIKYLMYHMQNFNNKFLEEKLTSIYPPKSEECLKIAQTPSWLYPNSYVYGPIILLTNFPFIKVFEKGGIFLCNMLLLFLLFATVLLYFWEYNWKNPVGLLLFASLLCIPQVLTYQSMIVSAGDIVPVFFMLMALIVIAKHNKSVWFPFFMALSIASKIAPGIVLLSVFLLRTRKELLFLLLFISLFFLPFIFWDYQGVYTSIIKRIIVHGTVDHTGVIYYLSPISRLIFKISVIIFLLFCFIKLFIRENNFSSICFFVFLSILGMLLINKYIHNNYIVWIQMTAAFCVFVWTNGIEFNNKQAIQYPWLKNVVEQYLPLLSWHRFKEYCLR